jgi:hypothetical protein
MKNFKSFSYFSFGSDKSSYGATVDTLQVPSVAMNKIYKAAVVLPNSYAKSKANFPSCTCFTAPMVILTIGCLKLPIKL